PSPRSASPPTPGTGPDDLARRSTPTPAPRAVPPMPTPTRPQGALPHAITPPVHQDLVVLHASQSPAPAYRLPRRRIKTAPTVQQVEITGCYAVHRQGLPQDHAGT